MTCLSTRAVLLQSMLILLIMENHALNQVIPFPYIDNVNTGTAYALVKGRGDYIGYTEVIPFSNR